MKGIRIETIWKGLVICLFALLVPAAGVAGEVDYVNAINHLNNFHWSLLAFKPSLLLLSICFLPIFLEWDDKV